MTVAIIPARGGSKRIPRKNIKLFCGKPLIAYSIEVALESELFDKVIVSTDDDEIATIAKEYGAEVPFLRPKEISDDFSSSGDAVEHAVKFLQDKDYKIDFVCTIYATSPLLQAKYLKKGYEKLKSSDAHMVFSATSMPFPIQRTFKITKAGRCKMFTPEYFSSRSQDLEEAYQDAGQFYWENLHVESTDIIFGKDSIPLILPRHLVQDIDTLEDFVAAEALYKIAFTNKFDNWNNLKQKLNNKKEHKLYTKITEIYFLSIGQNIGYESYGKDSLYLRPVLIYKKLSHTTFIGIPLTSKPKNGSYYFKFSYKKDKDSYASLNQLRVFDTKRISYKSGNISRNDFEVLKDKVVEFMSITSHPKKVEDA